MNSLQRVQAVFEGRRPDRLPVLPQSFLFAAGTMGYTIGQINRNPAKMAECHIHSWETFGYDGCIVDVDDATLAEACGAKVTYREGDVAVVDESRPVLKDLREVDDLKLPDPLKDGRISEWLETTERLAAKIGKEACIIGRADQGPFSLLCLLRGPQQFMMDLVEEDEEVIAHALEWTAKAHIIFAKAQLEAGAYITSMGDAYASPNLVSPDTYRTFALKPEQMVVDQAQTAEHPYSIHICGDTNRIIQDMGKTGARLLEIDWKVDMGAARKVLPDHTVMMGNINPSDPMYLGTPEQVREQVRHIIEATRGKGLIISSGCALGANTKPENVKAMVEAAKEYGSCERLEEMEGWD